MKPLFSKIKKNDTNRSQIENNRILLNLKKINVKEKRKW